MCIYIYVYKLHVHDVQSYLYKHADISEQIRQFDQDTQMHRQNLNVSLLKLFIFQVRSQFVEAPPKKRQRRPDDHR